MHPLPLAAGVALLGYLLMRRAGRSPVELAGGGLLGAVLLAFGFGLIPVPDIEQAALDIGRTLGKWTYLAVGTLAFLETGAFVGLVAPGETAILAGGVVAGQGEISVVVLIGITWACAVAGDLTSYMLGRRLGRGFLERHGPKLRITPERLGHVEQFMLRHGGPTILIGRFIGLVRAVAPFVAGTTRMPLRTFLPFDVIGAGAWGATFVILGFVFWHSFDEVAKYAGRGTLLIGTLAAVGVAVVIARDPRRRARVRAWLERRGILAPARFLYERVTPGRLGLELTTLVAVALAGGYAFVAMGLQVDTSVLLPGDRMAFDAMEPLRSEFLDDVARTVSDLGALPAAIVVTLAAGAYAVGQGRVTEAVALAAGLALTVLLVDVAKDGFGRARPVSALVDSEGLAYPSGHAAYASAYVAAAVALRRPGLVPIGLVVLAAVATTRVYLRAHFLSDVLGGAALALACFALAGAVALVVEFVRHNSRSPR
jgi:membrane protein DedA with SNARE-associated domain/membrane-associated phospholipid phosphatase